jgi:hypothetical protein
MIVSFIYWHRYVIISISIHILQLNTLRTHIERESTALDAQSGDDALDVDNGASSVNPVNIDRRLRYRTRVIKHNRCVQVHNWWLNMCQLLQAYHDLHCEYTQLTRDIADNEKAPPL